MNKPDSARCDTCPFWDEPQRTQQSEDREVSCIGLIRVGRCYGSPSIQHTSPDAFCGQHPLWQEIVRINAKTAAQNAIAHAIAKNLFVPGTSHSSVEMQIIKILQHEGALDSAPTKA